MSKIDLYFHYKYVGRFIMFNKSSYFSNSYEILNFAKVLVYFSIKDLEDLDDFCIVNYFFFIFFFFGSKSFFFNYNSVYHLRVTYYSFFIQCFFNNRQVFFVLNFMLNDVSKFNLEKVWNSEKFYFSVKDILALTDKRALTGFFNVRHTLNIRFFYTGIWTNRNVNLLFDLFKL